MTVVRRSVEKVAAVFVSIKFTWSSVAKCVIRADVAPRRADAGTYCRSAACVRRLQTTSLTAALRRHFALSS